MIDDYKDWIRSLYNLSIASGVIGITSGLERIINKDLNSALLLGWGFVVTASAGLCLGYLMEIENKNG